MRDKKGVEIVGEHVINIIVAVLCIFVLIYLGIQVYNFYLGGKQELKQAEFTLEMISGVVNVIQEGEKIEKVIVNPKGWYLINYSDMLCICENEALLEGKENCCKKGASSKIEFDVRIDDFCIVEYGITRTENCISLSKLPQSVFFGIKNGDYFLRTKETYDFFEIKDKFMSFKGNSDKSIEELIREHLQKKNQEQNLQKQIDLFLTINKIMYGERKGDTGQMGWQLRILKDNTLIQFINSPENRGMSYVLKDNSMPIEWIITDSGKEYEVKLYAGVWYYIPSV